MVFLKAGLLTCKKEIARHALFQEETSVLLSREQSNRTCPAGKPSAELSRNSSCKIQTWGEVQRILSQSHAVVLKGLAKGYLLVTIMCFNMATAISLLLGSIRIFNKSLLVPFFPFDSGKIMLAQAI